MLTIQRSHIYKITKATHCFCHTQGGISDPPSKQYVNISYHHEAEVQSKYPLG